MPSPFSVLYPHALCTFPYAPPYLHLIPDPNVIVYKSSVLRLCTSVHISTKSPILLLEVPLRVSTHLRTSAPLSLWNQGQQPWQGRDTQVYAKSLLSHLLSYLRQTSGPPLWLTSISLPLPLSDLSPEDPDLTGGSLPRLKPIDSHLGNAQVRHVFMLAFTGTCVSSNIASSFVMTASNPTIHIMQRWTWLPHCPDTSSSFLHPLMVTAVPIHSHAQLLFCSCLLDISPPRLRHPSRLCEQENTGFHMTTVVQMFKLLCFLDMPLPPVASMISTMPCWCSGSVLYHGVTNLLSMEIVSLTSIKIPPFPRTMGCKSSQLTVGIPLNEKSL